ncbi:MULTISPECIES: bifunctional dihydroorotate dehydrogenase B NAD binding subunit/NADPH-dependent glutamate synthase [Fusobacterium]|uniref:bifunctional dihydroorotate dehydrogenase B NAD binding subunit/NADPH-dependent glutamate synthase n=1 Tax=Fusobacterium TaxID=848 RepID=UPI00147775D9|nr:MULTISPECIES: bifunctional dihydroorotate dehydrogenase B NAD binding subunit/NADPH-dependent glutamate synthase [Fusobacterium]NME35496.1 bifunctional dihydroorotate dehydrogenase B NAD binding subunit/NADPH-dependent glutamate synthase [Fusobacterium sp. FSA-380-WT-3A]
MYKILKKEWLSEKICLMNIEAKDLALAAKPGQFLIVKKDEFGERIPLTICDYDREKGTVTIVFFVLGKSTKDIGTLEEGDFFQDVVGPLGVESEFLHEDLESLKNKKVLFVAGGVGTAPVYPQVKWFHENGLKADVIIGAKTKNLLILEKEMKAVAENLYITTDDGSYGYHGLVTDIIDDLIKNQGKKYDCVVAIGPMIMMKFVCLKTKEYNIKTTVSLNPLMVDGTGMCGACRVRIGDKIKFACVDGPEFDGHLVDFDEAMRRQMMYKTEEGRALLKENDGDTHSAKDCPIDNHKEEYTSLENLPKNKRVPVREQNPLIRATNFKEVTFGYTLEEAQKEASRCLNCKNPLCIQGCPVNIDIPAFIQEIKKGNIDEAGKILMKYTSLPAVCGRVCPQETQCEGKCILGIKGEAVAIGKLEKFIGDYLLKNSFEIQIPEKNNHKVAVIGSGPAGLTVAGDLAKMGYNVIIFEALHKTGGVLTYGIPEFRLPKDEVVQKEIDNIKKLGVTFKTNEIIGKTKLIDKLLDEEGFEAVFIGSGAGLPKFMNIPGENLNGVLSANEFLTRVNLMKGYLDEYETPIKVGKKVAVIGGGNVAMDAVRTAKRLGAEAHIVYRRSEKDFPARLEEVHHAKEEGIIIDALTLPKEILGNEKGEVIGMRCIKTTLGEKDSSGRASFIELENSDFIMDVDTVIMALGTSPNPLISSTTKNLDINKWKCIVADDNGQTSREGVFAGGDAVSGAATVILAMGAGKKAAKAIDEYIKSKNN